MNNQSNNSSWDISTKKDSIKSPESNTILDNFLFISNAYTAANIKHLLKFNITHIINLSECSNFWENQNDVNNELNLLKLNEIYYKSPTYLKIYITDTEDAPLEQYIDISIKFIKKASKLSVSHSASIIIAYLIVTLNISFDIAFEKVKKCRSVICPNLGFREKLLEYEKNIFSDEERNKFKDPILRLYSTYNILS
jgi:protein-tyrosine phosphatase